LTAQQNCVIINYARNTGLPEVSLKAGILPQNLKRVCLPKVWTHLERGSHLSDPFGLLHLGLDAFLSHPVLLGLVLAGVAYGVSFGIIPGVSCVTAMLTLIPFAFTMPITDSLALFAAIYCGATFGGAFSSILVNIPGGSESIATTFDGYPMSKKGLAGKAMGAAVMCSAAGGIVGALAFILIAPYLADFALRFSDADYLGIILMGFFVVGAISGKSMSKGLLSAAFGLLLGTVGLSIQTGESRFAFGILERGLGFVAIMIGVFALAEIFLQFSQALRTRTKRTIGKYTGSRFSLRELWGQKFNFIRSSILGTVIGFIPGIGATTASFASYGAAKSMSKTPEKFGTGIIDGVVAPEAANNAATGGAMIPLFCLGIPGGGATAVLLAVFWSQGLVPGPLIFTQQASMVGAIMLSMILANVLILLLGRPAAYLIAKGLKIDLSYLVIMVAVFCLLGGFSIRGMMLDPYSMVIAGVIGYYWKVYNFPFAPFILGLVLGPMAEARFMNAMIQHDMSVIGVLASPIGLPFILVGLAFFIIPILAQVRSRKGQSTEQPSVMLPSLFVYLALIGMAAYLFHLTNSWGVLEGRVGSAAWPRIILVSISVLSMINIWQWFVNYRRARRMGSGIEVSWRRFLAPEGIHTFLPMILIGAYYILINIVGFILLTLIFCGGTLYIGGVRKALPLILFSVGLTSVVLFIFLGFMQLYMPPGILFFADFHYRLYDILFALF